MLFCNDADVTDDFLYDSKTMKKVLKAATDEALFNDYVFLNAISKALYSCDDFVIFNGSSAKGCYLDQFVDVFERYLEYLYTEVMDRFINRYREAHSDYESEVVSDEVSTSTFS